ncbi:MAG: 3-hydroxybutyryl-CoA dehydrogenase, partial [Chloroflexi bacterium]|nr:3-hydroxybutyryl-CoA dehydrogenase [Chloroflexota bacterium]
DQDGRSEALGRLRHAITLEAVAEEADLVIEAALEDLALKQTIFRALDASAPVETLLATNTSALSVSAVAEATRRPGKVLGLHFFNPAPLMPLVEVAAGERTDPGTLRFGLDFATGLGKTAVACRDSPGFIVNRVNRPFTLEALRMLEAAEAGVEAIDLAVVGAGYPMGPFALMDLVGVDVNYAVARALYEAFDEAPRFRPSEVHRALVESGQLGRKTGAGFYRYEDGVSLGPADTAPVAADTRSPARGDIVARIELAIINEAYHAAGENVADPADIDRAMKLGANHPHGPFDRARELGLRTVIERLQRLQVQHGERFAVAPALWQVASI